MSRNNEFTKKALKNRGIPAKDLNIVQLEVKKPETVNLDEKVTFELPRYLKLNPVYTALEVRSTAYADLKDFPVEKVVNLFSDRLDRDLGIAYRYLYEKNEAGEWEIKDSEDKQLERAELIENIFYGKETAVFNHENFSGKRKSPSQGGKSDLAKVMERAESGQMSEDEYNQLMEVLSKKFPPQGKQARK